MSIWLQNTKSKLYNAFLLQFIPLRVYGLYPFNGWPRHVYDIYAMIMYVILIVPVPILASIYVGKLLSSSNGSINMVEISDSLMVITEMGVNIFKYLDLKLHPNSIKKTMDWLNFPLFNSFDKRQERMIEKAYDFCRKFYFLFFLSCCSTLLTWASKSLFSNNRKFPVEIWLPFDPYENSFVYYFLHLYIFLSATNTVFCNSALDTLITGLIYQAAIQVRIIKSTVANLQAIADEKLLKPDGILSLEPAMKATKKNNIIYGEIARCVRRYGQVKRFVADIEDVYSFALFSQFAISVLLICFQCLQLSIVEPLSYRFFYIITTLITTTSEVFMYCYAGSLIYNETLSLNSDLYISNWLDLDLKCQKALIIIMEYGKHPFIIRAGKLVDLSLDTFTLIIRRSYSLLAILQNYN
ncbi:odorant receptor Or1-like isoform X1 [Rhynchophorus ferrugineus]|uniref:odorant receptor Or1-like isoform X1 n=1 Tax=Rhynchophorus ferrugineus TaxID=354439 RepID=UPI003FCDAEB4